MEKSNVHKAKSVKEELMELLEKKPPIYSVAVKYSFAVHSGIMFSSVFGDVDSKRNVKLYLRNCRRMALGVLLMTLMEAQMFC